MIIIPIGHESKTVRRQPWVTFGIMLLCTVVFLVTHLGYGDPEIDFEALEEAVDYYLGHSYLEPDSRLRDFAEAVDGTIPGPDSLGELSRFASPEQQERLDRLTKQAFGQLDRHPLKRFGLVTGDLGAGAFVSHMFLHAGWLHLLGNLFLLFLAGSCIEDVWGRPLYTSFYLLAGIAAACVFALGNPGLDTPMVGASGAIAGTMGAFLVRYGSSRIRFFWAWGIWAHGTFAAPAFLMLPLWLGKELFWAAMSESVPGGTGVAHWAHVGGFLFGMAAAGALRAYRVEERFIHHRIESKITSAGNAAVAEAMAARAEGRDGDAFDLLLREAQRAPGDADVAFALFDVATLVRRAEDAAPFMLRVIRDRVRRGEATQALEHWLELTRHVPRPPAESGLLLRIAPLLAAASEPDAAGAALRAAFESSGAIPAPGLARRVAELARDVDPALALSAAQAALSSGDLDPAGREKLEQLVAEVEPRAMSQLAEAQYTPDLQETRAIELAAGDDTSLELATEAGRGAAASGSAQSELGTDPFREDAVDGLEDMLDFEARSFAADSDEPAPAARDGRAARTAAGGTRDGAPASDTGSARSDAAGGPLALGPPADTGSGRPMLDPGSTALELEPGDIEPTPPLGAEAASAAPEASPADPAARIATVPAAPAAPAVAPSASPDFSQISLPPLEAADLEAVSGTPPDAPAARAAAPPAPIADREPAVRPTDPPAARELEGLTDETLEAAAAALLGQPGLDPPAASEVESGPAAAAREAGAAAAAARVALPREQVQPAPARPRPASGAGRLHVIEARPLALEDGRLDLGVGGRDAIALTLERVRAIGVAAVRGIGPKPVILIDLLVGARAGAAPRVIRLRSNGFDPRRFAPGAEPLDAMRALLDELVRASGATPLPDANAACGRPFVTFESLEAYEREVLGLAGA